MKLTPKQRDAVYEMFGRRCAYCGHELPVKGWHADHVEPVMRDSKLVKNERGHYEYRQTGSYLKPENDQLANIYPSCRACNIDKSCEPLELWRNSLSIRVDVCRRNHSAFRHAERFGLIQVTAKPIVFWFEQYVDKGARPK